MKIKSTLFLIAIIFITSSCNLLETKLPNDTIEESLKEGLFPKKGYFLRDVDYFRYLHRNEILRTLKIEEKIEVKGTDLCLVLFSYSVASQIKKESQWFRNVDGKWTYCYKYFSTYDDDPLGNGDKELAKEILDKAEKWKESTEDIWW